MKAKTNATTPAEMLQNLSIPAFDFEALFTAQRHNLDAAVEAYRVATEGMKAVAKRQDEMVKQTIGQLQSQAGKLETPEKYLELATSMVRSSFDQVREISELAVKANKDVLDVVVKRSNDAMGEIKAAVKVGQA